MKKQTGFFSILIMILVLLPASKCYSQNPSWMYWDPWNSLIPSRILPDLDIDDNGIKWIATEPICGGGICTDGGLASFNGSSFTVYDSLNSTLNSNFIGAVHIDQENVVWAGTGHGQVSSFDGINWEAHPFPTKNNVPVTDIASDLYGYIWATTGGDGIYMFDGSEWLSYNSSNSIVADYVSSVKVGPDNSVWCGGAGNKIFRFSDEWTETQLPDEVYFTSTLAINNENRVWVGSDGIFCNYYAGEWTIFNESITGIPDTAIGYVFDIAFDFSGNTWIGHSEGLIKYDGTEWTPYLPSNSGLLSRHIMSLVADELGNLWIGTADTGLIAYNEGGVVNIQNPEPKTQNLINISAFPNPFRSSLNISYTLPEAKNIQISVIDMMGRHVRVLQNGPQVSGDKSISWDGRNELGHDCPAGIYVIFLTADNKRYTQRILKNK